MWSIGVMLVLGLGSLHLGRFGLSGLVVKAALRMLVQLALAGLVLAWVFKLQSGPVTLAYLGMMTLAASYIACERQEKRYPQLFWQVSLALSFGVWTSTALALVLLEGGEALLTPRHLIPLFGITCGNMLSGFTIGCREFSERLDSHQAGWESRLSLGATAWEAMRPEVKRALEKALLPITNSMLSAGIVSLPGALSGQLAAGQDPWYACLYQMLILATILAATCLGTIVILMFNFHKVAKRYDL